MSSNDVFIVAGAAAGRVRHVTWMWPTWDVWGPRHGEGNVSVYNRGPFRQRVGTMTYTSRRLRTLFTMCLCLWRLDTGELYACEVGDNSLSEETPWLSSAKVPQDVYHWIRDRCDFNASFDSFHLSDQQAMRGDFDAFKDEGNALPLVLDIDLDFFGCTGLGEAQRMLGTLPQDLVKLAALQLLQFHVQTVHDELAVNDMFRADVQQAWRVCWSARSSRTTTCANSTTYSLFARTTRTRLSKMLKVFNETAFQVLGNALYRIVIAHPNAAHMLNAVGFCLFTTPSTYRSVTPNYEGDPDGQHLPRGLKLCGHLPAMIEDEPVHNDNSPVTRAALTSPFDMERRLAVFGKAMEHLARKLGGTKPRLITLCRSVRDGYTLTATWEQVERGVLQVLHRVFGSLYLVYDGNLLGGKEGWNRHTQPFSS